MKKIVSVIVSIIMLHTVFAEKGIVVTQKYTDAAFSGATITVTWYVTATHCKMKMEYADANSHTTNYFIPDVKSGKLLTYSDGAIPAGSKKMFFAISVNDIKGGGSTDVSRISVSKTGETKELMGIKCEKVIAKTNKGETTMWVTTDFAPAFYSYFAYFRNSLELMSLSEEKVAGVFLQSETKDVSGTVTSASRLVSASSTDIPDSEFQVPSEYSASSKN